jgi:hypothetical protein
VIEHKNNYSKVRDLSTPIKLPDLSNDRFVFEVTYVNREVEFFDQYWFATKKGKIIFTVYNDHSKSGRISYRADLKAFYAHFSSKIKMWVYKNSPVVHLCKDVYAFPIPSADPLEGVEVKTHRCDFSQCRYHLEFSYALDPITKGMPSEVISESYKALKIGLTSKVPEINKILTGADNDGEMMSPKGMHLCDNLLCRQCGYPVFASAENKYKFECLKHGELDHHGIMRVDPVEYQRVLGYTFDTLEALIQKSCPQD